MLEIATNIPKNILQNLEIGQVWRHYKGNHYEVIYITRHSESGEILIVYKRIEDGNSYARPIDLFFSTVEYEDKLIPRFILMK